MKILELVQFVDRQGEYEQRFRGSIDRRPQKKLPFSQR
jgi:hypothetical protein